MSAKRSSGQKAVIVMMDQRFIDKIDECLANLGFGDRSTLIRVAVYEKLKNMGHEIPREITSAPPRKGKGGPSLIKHKIKQKGLVNIAAGGDIQK